MNTQEAYTRNIKLRSEDIEKNDKTILVFPTLPTSLHALFTGNTEIIKTFSDPSPLFKPLAEYYQQAIAELKLEGDHPVNVIMSKDELVFQLVKPKTEVSDVERADYCTLSFSSELETINVFATALSHLITSVLRTIPKLIQNDIQCRNVTQLNREQELLRCYLQNILSTKMTSYINMCQNTSYVIDVPKPLAEYYTSGNFLQMVPSMYKNEETNRYEEDPNKQEYVAVVTNYSGQKKKTRLFIRSIPRREATDSSRYMITGAAQDAV